MSTQSSPSSQRDLGSPRQHEDRWRGGYENPLEDPEWLRFWGTVPAEAVPVANASAAITAWSGRGVLLGGVVVNTAGTGHVSILDGQDAGGALVARLDWAAAGALQFNIPSRGVLLTIGAYWSPSANTFTGTLYIARINRYPKTPPGM